jgi:peptidoglycan hydrolase-like protein with peptidoglycan-binding domain
MTRPSATGAGPATLDAVGVEVTDMPGRHNYWCPTAQQARGLAMQHGRGLGPGWTVDHDARPRPHFRVVQLTRRPDGRAERPRVSGRFFYGGRRPYRLGHRDEGRGLHGELLGAEQEFETLSSNEVMWIQSTLNKVMNSGLPVDGLLGPLTRAAIMAFQRREGLAVDGIVGPLTTAALQARAAGGPYAPAPAPPAGAPGGFLSVPCPAGGSIVVAAQLAPQLRKLLLDARAAGYTVCGGGYRSSAKQIELRRQNCGPTQYDIYTKPSGQCSPPTAIPGTSMHEKGLAVDFATSTDGYTWLKNHSPAYGLYLLVGGRERWHFSTNGH